MTMPPSPPPEILQNVILPEPGLCTEPELYYHAEGVVSLDLERGELRLERGAQLRFDSYFNMLSIAKWHWNGPVEALALRLRAQGHFELRVLQASPGQSWMLLASQVLRLAREGEVTVALAPDTTVPGSVLWFELRALGPSRLAGAAYQAAAVPGPRPRLAICITTYRREAAARATAARLEAHLAASGAGGRMRVFVIDNGGTLTLPPLQHVERLANPNLGGAGGFARGLAEARARGFSHCLFMDDDAAIPLEALHRAEGLLARARDPRRAVAAAMISTRHRWALWEAGARFDLRCRPEQGGRDLRRRDEVLALELATSGPVPPDFYAGFWFFAFPIAGLRAEPFPFFVRGDDVSFSLANDFAPVRMNGIVAFQDDFVEKESPTTRYLDLRSHLVHHLSLPGLARGRLALAMMPLGFVMASIARFHYDSAAAELTAWADVLEGPRIFADAPGAEARRRALAADTIDERRGLPPPVAPRRLLLRFRLFRALLRLTLNGHGLPLRRLWAGRAAIHAEERASRDRVLGCDRYSVTFRADGSRYVVQRSDRRAASLLWRACALALRQLRGHDALTQSYRAAYPQLTRPEFWARHFDPAVADPPAEPGSGPGARADAA
ncbi:glycosyl transferase [Frigidibacter sp. MR17.24]|uniref:glycosyl transferase n=1 Tax=Frigidibacter sp. MR17.24 TaxID=3127345 RepID=UPI003012F597